MARKSNAFGGEIQRWATGLAAWGLRELLRSRSNAPFYAKCAGVPCLILPIVDPDHVKLTVLYGCKRALSAKRLTDSSEAELISEWRKICRAFIVCELNPSNIPFLRVHDHNATRNAASALLDQYCLVGVPTLADLDQALGTSLEISETKPFKRVTEAISAIGHH
jgi:hypothetical protein